MANEITMNENEEQQMPEIITDTASAAGGIDINALFAEDPEATAAALAAEEAAVAAEAEEDMAEMDAEAAENDHEAAAAEESNTEESTSEESTAEESAEPAAAEEVPAEKAAAEESSAEARPARRARTRRAAETAPAETHEDDQMIRSINGSLEASTEGARNYETMMTLVNNSKTFIPRATYNNVLHGRITGAKPFAPVGMCAIVMFDSYTILIPDSVMSVNDNIVKLGERNRTIRMIQRIGAEVDFMIPEIGAINSEQHFAAASRKLAQMIEMRDFYSRTDRNNNYVYTEGIKAEAKIVAMAPAYMVVDVRGVECAVPARDLGVRDIMQETAYNNGDTVIVQITKLERVFGKNGHTIDSVNLEVKMHDPAEKARREAMKQCVPNSIFSGTITNARPNGYYVDLDIGVTVQCQLGGRNYHRGDSAIVQIRGTDTVTDRRTGEKTEQIWGRIITATARR